MVRQFFGNPEITHNNDSKKRPQNKNARPEHDQEAIDNVVSESDNFYELIKKYSQEDPDTWRDSLIAAARHALFFEVSQAKKNTDSEIHALYTNLRGDSQNTLEKIILLAEKYGASLDSTITVERAAVAYYEGQKNIYPKNQQHIKLLKFFYPKN